MSRTPVLDREFLEVRSLIIQLAAALDRLERDGTPADDPRMQRIVRSIAVLTENGPSRAEQIQLLFSRDYHPAWRQQLGV